MKIIVMLVLIFHLCLPCNSYGQPTITSEQDIQNLMSEAHHYFEQKNNRATIEKCEEVLNHLRWYPNNTFSKDFSIAAYTLMGISFQELNKHAVAIDKLEKAVDIIENYYKYFKPSDAMNLNAMELKSIIALSYETLGDYDSAINYLEQVYNFAKDTNAELEKTSAQQLGYVFLKSGNYTKAVDYYKRALNLIEEKEVFGRAAMLEGLFSCYMNVDIIEAISCVEEYMNIVRNMQQSDFEKYLAISETKLNMTEPYGPFPDAKRYIGKEYFEALAHLNAGTAYLNISNYSKAINHYQKGLEIARNLKYSYLEMLFEGSIGTGCMLWGNYDEAIKLLQRTVDYFENEIEVNKSNIYYLNLVDNLGTAYMYNERYQKAITYFEKTIDLVNNVMMNRKEQIYIEIKSISAVKLSIIYYINGDKERARELIKKLTEDIMLSFDQVLLLIYTSGEPGNIINKTPDDVVKVITSDYPGTISIDKYLIWTYVYARSLEKLGGKKKAYGYFKRAVNAIENQREELSEDQRANYLGKMIAFPDKLISVYEGLIRTSLTDDEAFEWSEAIKARLLIEQLSGKHNDIDFNIPESLRKNEIKFNNDIAAKKIKKEYAIKSNDKDYIMKIEEEFNNLKHKRAEFIEGIRRDKKLFKYAAIKYPEPLSLNDIDLKPDEVLFEYAVTESETIAWMIKNGEIVNSIHVNISRKELDELIEKHLNQLNPYNRYRGRLIDAEFFDPEPGNELFNKLMKRFIPLIKAGDKIIIVPDKKLGMLPFETLITDISDDWKLILGEQECFPYPDGISYLGDDFEISYYQSASALTMIRTLEGEKSERPLFVLADPVFNKSDERFKGDGQSATEKNKVNLISSINAYSGAEFPRLENTSNIVTELGKIYNIENDDILIGPDATETNLKKKNLSEYRTLVFATHGFLDFRASGLMEPALVLTQFGNSDGDDGFLTMSEVMGLNLNCEVSALTACSTGTGKFVSGEGIMGLSRAFQYAGSESVLASLWEVEENSATKLMKSFYNYLDEDKGKLGALQKARNDVRNEGYKHPYYWAPFILIGEPN